MRKLSGFNAPSKANEAAFELAVAEVSTKRAQAADLAAHPCARAGPRNRGGEGEGAQPGAVRISTARRLSPESRPAYGRGSATGTKRGSLDAARRSMAAVRIMASSFNKKISANIVTIHFLSMKVLTVGQLDADSHSGVQCLRNKSMPRRGRSQWLAAGM